MKVIMKVILLCLLLLVPLNSYAEDINGRFGIGWFNLIATRQLRSKKYGGGLNFSGTYGINRNIAGAFDISVQESEGKHVGSNMVSLIPSIQVRYPDIKRISPYLSFGMGYHIATNETKDSLALKAGGGIDIFLTSNIAFVLETNWIYDRSKSTSGWRVSKNSNFDFIQYKVGIKFFSCKCD